MVKQVSKNYGDTFLYGKGEYEKKIFTFMMHSNEITRDIRESEQFFDIVFEVKRRQVTSVISTVLMSNNIVLLDAGEAMPKAFKVFAAKDVRNDKKTKVFVDVTDIIRFKDGKYVCTNIDTLISYLLSAMQYLIYYTDPRRLVNNNAIITTSTSCFADLFTYVLDYLRISGLSSIRNKCLYLSSLYYQVCLLGRDLGEGTKNIAKKIADVTPREQQILDLLIEIKDFDNIATFVSKMADILKLDKFTLDVFIDKWIYLFGGGTQFATELYPAFSSLLTNAYCGAYLNNQKTIEKCVGTDMVSYVNALFKVGSEAK